MKKLLIAASILCFAIHSHADTKAIEKSFNWVVADRSELQRFIHDRVKRETAYPSDINIDEQKLNEQRNAAQMNLSTFVTQGRKNCNDKFLPKDGTQSLPSEVRNFESQGTGVATDPNWDKYYKIRSSKEYIDCFTKLNEDPAYKLLQEKQKDIDNIIRKRRDFDENTRKRSEKYLDAIVADYSETNNIQLIVNSRSDTIVYNKDLVVLDVTQKLKSIINFHKRFTD